MKKQKNFEFGLKVRSKQSGLLTLPGYDALNDLMNALDPYAYAAALTAWLQEPTMASCRAVSRWTASMLATANAA